MDEDEQQEEYPEASGRQLGLERWVLFGYILFGAIAFWLYDKVVTLVWDEFAEPQELAISAVAALLGISTAVLLWRHEKSRSFADEAAAELSKVTWPSREETWSNTIVVVITSIIASIILFSFDAAWSWVTDLIYL